MDLRISKVLLMNDVRYPWVILVPRVAGVQELYDLHRAQRALFTDEITATAKALQTVTKGHKMNVGALGNIVRQLHVHVIARFEKDATWPGPVWGEGEREPYADNGDAFAALLRPQIVDEMAAL
ncbi:MAG: HIT family protein [Pseudomonadota bacterium]